MVFSNENGKLCSARGSLNTKEHVNRVHRCGAADATWNDDEWDSQPKRQPSRPKLSAAQKAASKHAGGSGGEAAVGGAQGPVDNDDWGKW